MEDVHQPESPDRSESTPHLVVEIPATLEHDSRRTPYKPGGWVHPARRGLRDGSVASQHAMPLAPISDLIPMERISALSDLYFSHIHPIIPILNEQEYRESLSAARTPPILAHVICLLAAKDSGADEHLYLLRSSEVTVTSRQFCSHVYASITTALRTWNNLKKTTLISVLALLSLHQEGHNGVDEASGHLAQAVNHSQTLGLHILPHRDDGFEMKRTFWCL
ncbi:hypothetical protein F5Y03DRAFT_376841 [Xylaria venustula]|nr:hypothetical protein F5Y03DRAFT_376841 [Xylaria venustula]